MINKIGFTGINLFQKPQLEPLNSRNMNDPGTLFLEHNGRMQRVGSLNSLTEGAIDAMGSSPAMKKQGESVGAYTAYLPAKFPLGRGETVRVTTYHDPTNGDITSIEPPLYLKRK